MSDKKKPTKNDSPTSSFFSALSDSDTTIKKAKTPEAAPTPVARSAVKKRTPRAQPVIAASPKKTGTHAGRKLDLDIEPESEDDIMPSPQTQRAQPFGSQTPTGSPQFSLDLPKLPPTPPKCGLQTPIKDETPPKKSETPTQTPRQQTTQTPKAFDPTTQKTEATQVSPEKKPAETPVEPPVQEPVEKPKPSDPIVQRIPLSRQSEPLAQRDIDVAPLRRKLSLSDITPDMPVTFLNKKNSKDSITVKVKLKKSHDHKHGHGHDEECELGHEPPCEAGQVCEPEFQYRDCCMIKCIRWMYVVIKF